MGEGGRERERDTHTHTHTGYIYGRRWRGGPTRGKSCEGYSTSSAKTKSSFALPPTQMICLSVCLSVFLGVGGGGSVDVVCLYLGTNLGLDVLRTHTCTGNVDVVCLYLGTNANMDLYVSKVHVCANINARTQRTYTHIHCHAHPRGGLGLDEYLDVLRTHACTHSQTHTHTHTHRRTQRWPQNTDFENLRYDMLPAGPEDGPAPAPILKVCVFVFVCACARDGPAAARSLKVCVCVGVGVCVCFCVRVYSSVHPCERARVCWRA